MIERVYNPADGQVIADYQDVHATPHQFVTGAEGSGQPDFEGPNYTWSPSDTNDDPHADDYQDIGESIAPLDVSVPPNIVVGAGPFSRSRGHDSVQLPPS